MAENFHLVQTVAIFQDKSYPCTIDTGSSLNLIHWKTVLDFGLENTLVGSYINFKVADGRIAKTMGELNNVQLTFWDCSYCLSLAVVDDLEHTLLVGMSFVHQAGGILDCSQGRPFLSIQDAEGHRANLPVTYHRSHPWIQSLESDPRCWPSEQNSLGERAYMPSD